MRRLGIVFAILGALYLGGLLALGTVAAFAQLTGVGYAALQGFVVLSQPSGGGQTTFHLVGAAGANQDLTVVASGAHQLYSANISQINANASYVKVFDAASGCTNGTPKVTFIIPGNTSGAGNNYAEAVGIPFSTGICIRITSQLADGTDSTSALTASTFTVDLRYN